jgi:hypothetical protein
LQRPAAWAIWSSLALAPNTDGKSRSTPASTSEVAITRTCGSGMTLRTGKSGRYRCYTCAGCAQTAKSKCPGRSIAMEVLDGMLLEHLGDKLFTPQRLQVILKAYVVRSAEADAGQREQL